MFRLAVLAVLLLAGYCYGSNRIVGGSSVPIERHPSIVQVEDIGVTTSVWSQHCGATIINNLYVLSAAHCFDGSNYSRQRTRIRAGTASRSSGGVIINIVREFNHPNWPRSSDADITVVSLASPLAFNNAIQPASIPAQNTNIAAGLAVIYAGWGRIWDGGPSSPVLLNVQVYTVSNAECSRRYGGGQITANNLCAGVLDVGGRDACGMDSGGPLYLNNMVIGVISWGNGCALPNYPGVNVAVASYTNWIVNLASQPV